MQDAILLAMAQYFALGFGASIIVVIVVSTAVSGLKALFKMIGG